DVVAADRHHGNALLTAIAAEARELGLDVLDEWTVVADERHEQQLALRKTAQRIRIAVRSGQREIGRGRAQRKHVRWSEGHGKSTEWEGGIDKVCGILPQRLRMKNR